MQIHFDSFGSNRFTQSQLDYCMYSIPERFMHAHSYTVITSLYYYDKSIHFALIMKCTCSNINNYSRLHAECIKLINCCTFRVRVRVRVRASISCILFSGSCLHRKNKVCFTVWRVDLYKYIYSRSCKQLINIWSNKEPDAAFVVYNIIVSKQVK